VPGNNPARHWPGTQPPQWPCVGFYTDSRTGIIGVAHLYTHKCAAILIPSTMTRLYCAQQIISLVGGSVLQRSPAVCQGGLQTMQGVLCKTSNTMWFPCSLGHWRTKADWIEMESQWRISVAGVLKMYQYNLKLSLSLVSLLSVSVTHMSRLEEKEKKHLPQRSH